MNGYGFAAIADGISKGMVLGKKIRSAYDEAQLRKTTQEGMEQAKAQRQADLEAAVRPVETGDMQGMRNEMAALQGIGSAATPQKAPPLSLNPTENAPYQPKAPEINTSGPLAGAGLPEKSTRPTGKFMADGKEYGSRDDAMKAVDANADSLMTYFNKTAGPKVQELLMSQGRVDQAEAWGKYLGEGATKQGMKHWASAVAHMQAGNMDKAADFLTKAQNVQGYGTGLKIAGIKQRKGDDGSVQGVTVEYEGEDGKKASQDFASIEDLTQFGVSALNPAKQFEYWLGQKKRAEDLRAEAAKQRAEDTKDANKQARAFGFDIGKQNNQGRINRANKEAELQSRSALGIGENGGIRASMSNSDREYRLHETLLKTNMDYLEMNPQEQALYRQDMLKTLAPIQGGIGGMGTANGVPLLQP